MKARHCAQDPQVQIQTEERHEDEVQKERQRIDEAGEQGSAPRTCFQCVVHGVAVCKKFNCWQLHLAEVTQEHENEFSI